MKFGRLLRCTSIEGVPNQDLFAAYKGLKKKIKQLPSKEQLAAADDAAAAAREAEQAFVAALSATLNHLNEVFMEKEETSVIRIERLEHQLAGSTTAAHLNELHKAFVDFHGEVLLAVHWSILAYTATVKILKKHHKRTGLLVDAPQLGNLLAQPFCSTELMTSIAQRVEFDIQRLAERMGVSTPRRSEPSQQQQLATAAVAAQRPQHHQHVASEEQQGATPRAGAGANTALAAAMAAPGAAAAAGGNTSGVSAAAGGLAAAAAAAAAMAAGDQDFQLLPNVNVDGLDMQLLRQLAAESESMTSRSEGDGTAELDTCASRQRRTVDGPHSGSQQAHLQQHAAGDDDDAHQQPEVESGSAKRRRLLVEQPDEAAKACGGGGTHAAAAAAATPASSAQPAPPSAAAPAAAAAPGVAATSDCVATSGEAQQEVQQAAAACPRHDDEPQQAQPVAATATAAGGDAPGSCAHEASIMRQTQVALTTWRHLQSTASTPSTVVQGGVGGYAASTEGALTASSAVQ